MFLKYLSFTLLCTSILIYSGISPSYAGPFFKFTVLDAPGAFSTEAYDINNLGQISGISNRVSFFGTYITFVYDKGNYQIIANTNGMATITPFGINDAGQMVGQLLLSDRTQHGFVYIKGVFTTIDHPYAVQPRGTQLLDINNQGHVVGKFVGSNLLPRGFIYKDGAMTNFKVPKAKSTNPDSINDRGVIVGSYFDKKNQLLGFVYKNKKFITIRHPEGVKGTKATGINNRGLIVGNYFDRASKGHGFVYTKGKFININVPGAGNETFPQGINDNNQIVGYFNKSFFGHGFLVAYTTNAR